MIVKRLYIVFIIAAVIIGLFLRISWILECNRGTKWKADEYSYYVSMAENVFNGKGFFPAFNNKPRLNQGGEHIPPPMQSLFLLLIYKIAGKITDPIIPRIMQALLGSIMIILCAEIGRRLVSPFAGIVFAFLFAIYPEFVFHVELLMTESNYLSCLVLMLFLLMLWNKEGSPFMACLCSVCLGILTLQRGISLLLGTVLGCFALSAFKNKNGILSAAAFMIIPFCVLMPWFVRNMTVYKEPVLVSSHEGLALYLSNNQHIDPVKEPYAFMEIILNEDYKNNTLIPELEKKYRRQDGKKFTFPRAEGTLIVSWYEYSEAYKKEVFRYVMKKPLHFMKNILLKTWNQFWLVQNSTGVAVKPFKSRKAFWVMHRIILFGGLLGLLVVAAWGRSRGHALIGVIFLYFSCIISLGTLDPSGRYNMYLKLFLMFFLAAGIDIGMQKYREWPSRHSVA